MAFSITGQIKVSTLKKRFLKEFGLTLRVYDGRSFADEGKTISQIRKKKGSGDLSVRKSMKVGTLEEKIESEFGIKVQIAGSDDSYLCDNELTLASAHEKDEKKAKESLQVQFDKMFDEVDKSSKKYKLGKLPAGLTAERVSQHMESKVEQRKYKSKLRTLAEIRFYNYNQLIDKPRTEALYSAILGPKAGKTLASGAPKAREKAIESLLPKTGAGGRPAPPKKAFR